MSNEAQGLVRNLPMDAPHKPILMAYANYSDEAGYCWPGVETIAFDTGYSVPTVVRARRELVKANWMRSKRQFGSSATTRLNLPKIAKRGVDRGDRIKIRPEFEFEDETAGHTRTDHSDLNDETAGHTRTDHSDLNDETAGHTRTDHSDLNSQITLISTTDHSDHLSIREPSVDPSLDARGSEGASSASPENTPPEWALTLIADLDFGRFRRPTRKRAESMARLVAAAHASGLSEREIRRHCRAALNEATSNGAAYLQGALDPENLPVPSALPQRSGGQADPAADDERAEEQAESPMLRTQAQDEIRRILSGARAQSR